MSEQLLPFQFGGAFSCPNLQRRSEKVRRRSEERSASREYLNSSIPFLVTPLFKRGTVSKKTTGTLQYWRRRLGATVITS